jgi:hypothetical protein
MSDKTLRDILEEVRTNRISFSRATSKMSDFEKTVMEDIIDFSDEVFGISRYECLENIYFQNIEPLTRRYWESKLNTGGVSEWLKETGCKPVG